MSANRLTDTSVAALRWNSSSRPVAVPMKSPGSAMRAVQRPSIASLISGLAIETFSNPID
jgi:hypothetical protein